MEGLFPETGQVVAFEHLKDSLPIEPGKTEEGGKSVLLFRKPRRGIEFQSLSPCICACPVIHLWI